MKIHHNSIVGMHMLLMAIPNSFQKKKKDETDWRFENHLNEAEKALPSPVLIRMHGNNMTWKWPVTSSIQTKFFFQPFFPLEMHHPNEWNGMNERSNCDGAELPTDNKKATKTTIRAKSNKTWHSMQRAFSVLCVIRFSIVVFVRNRHPNLPRLSRCNMIFNVETFFNISNNNDNVVKSKNIISRSSSSCCCSKTRATTTTTTTKMMTMTMSKKLKKNGRT